MTKRTDEEWLLLCDKIRAGFTPNGSKRDTWLTRKILTERLFHWYDGAPFSLNWKTLIDLGCSNGRLPMGLIDAGVSLIDYHGVEIIKPCVEFCMMAFSPWKYNYKFHHMDIENSHYWSIGKEKSISARLPFFDSQADIFWANSVFTHLGTPDVTKHYLSEAHRIMKPGAMMITTWRIAQTSEEVSYNPKQSIFLEYDIMDWFISGGFDVLGTRPCATTPQVEFCTVKR